jgi:hypothetical protein
VSVRIVKNVANLIFMPDDLLLKLFIDKDCAKVTPYIVFLAKFSAGE